MRFIIAVVDPAQVDAVRQALVSVHVTRFTICDGHSYDSSLVGVSQQAVIEIAVTDDFLAAAVEAIEEVQMLDHLRESIRLWVLPIEEAVQIYREVRGPEAV